MSSTKTIEKLISAVLKKATYNSTRTEFCCNFKCTARQRALAETLKTNYVGISVDGNEWMIKTSFHWSSQMPVYFYGYKK